jgi:hypothetical protein
VYDKPKYLMSNSPIAMPKKPTVDRNLLVLKWQGLSRRVIRVAVLCGREKSLYRLKTETPTRMAGLASHNHEKITPGCGSDSGKQ